MNVHCACSEWDFSLIGNKEGERPMAGCHTLWSINWLIDHSEAKQTCEGRGVRAELGKEGGQSMPPTLVEMVQVRVCLTHSQACVRAASFFFLYIIFYFTRCVCVYVWACVRVALCFPSFKWRQRIQHSTGEQESLYRSRNSSLEAKALHVV